MPSDITKYGPQSGKDLQKANSQKQNGVDWDSIPVGSIGRNLNKFNSEAYTPVGIQAASVNYGESQYDDSIVSANSLENIQDIRYNEQPWYDVLANGVGKMLGTAGTTFVSSLIGLPYGLYEAANQGRWSALWDNDVTQGLADVDKWLEENMTNYQSQAQQEDPRFRLGDMNWWADNVIKNMGFTLGAAASMAVGAGSLGLLSKSLGIVNNVSKGAKIGNGVLSALFSATGEGMIEARQGVEERNKLEMQRLDDALAPEYSALETARQQVEQQYAATGDYQAYRNQMGSLLAQKQELDNRKAEGQRQIEESGLEMGNAILGANQVLLTVGNLIQFGKGITKSFDRARHAAETSARYAKPFGVTAGRVGANLSDGYKVSGKALGRTIAGTKGIITEGSEEMNQQWAQSSAGAYFNEKDVNDYWKARLDKDAYRDTTDGLYSIGSAISQGFNESWGDRDQWEQFLIGGMTGALGSYMPSRIFNQDKTKSRFDPRRYGEWSGGAVNEIGEFNRQYDQYNENISEINSILASEDFPTRVRSLVAHTYTEGQKQQALENDDKKAWKDADDKQTIHDIQAFLRAGKLDDLRAIYNELGSQMSDGDIESIVARTTKEISKEEDKQNHDRMVDEQIASRQREIDSIYNDLEGLQTSLLGSTDDSYDVNRDYVLRQQQEMLQRISDGEQEIERLNQEKDAYTGQKYYVGPYVDSHGNVVATNEEISNEVKHNSEELTRKLDSYLDSIDYVNRRTGGNLTKDQEDNLAYLHNMGKQSIDRMNRIMAGVRNSLPSKFLIKTNKTPEQLARENTSSDRAFTKDESTKEGYVEVDTSLMNDDAFADFFQREIIRGGNIRPEFAETAEERAAREEEENNLPEDEKKRKAKERLSKKWKDSMQRMQDDAKEQWSTNWDILVDNFMDNYGGNNTTQEEKMEAFSGVAQDLKDASDLYNQAGEYFATLNDYMANPEKIDSDKSAEESKAQKAENEQQVRNRFVGKDARQIKQELVDGALDLDDFEDFAAADLSNVTDDDVKEAQQEVRKAQEGMQKASSLKQHINDSISEDPTPEEIDAAERALRMIDNANLAADDPSDISIDMPELSQIPLDDVDINASIEDVDAMNQRVQEMLADAFNAIQEDENAQDDIPEEVPGDALEGVESPETGSNPVTKTAPVVVSPDVPAVSEAASGPVPKNPITDSAIDSIIHETGKVYEKPNMNGTWRTTTTRHPYGRSTGTYHENVARQQFGEDSVEYRRSKAIWEYLNSTGAFDRLEKSGDDRINRNGKDTIHFMVRNFAQEMYGRDFGDLDDAEKTYSMVMLMLDDNGEVLGDLPLAELEPSFKSGNPTQQVKELKTLEDKVFKKYIDSYRKNGSNEAIVDGVLKSEGRENLNMTFDNARKSPLVSKVKQVMRGVVPYRKSEKNTLNDVAGGMPFELGIAVTENNIAKKRGDKTQHREIAMPHVGTVGQPYLLLQTPSGEQIAVPFYMPAFDPEKNRHTELYKLLVRAVSGLLSNNSQTTDGQKNEFLKSLDVLKGLLQVDNQKNRKVIKIGKDSVSLHLQSLTDPDSKIDVSVPNISGNNDEIARTLVDGLGGIPINVSLQYLNDKIETGSGSTKYTRDYNQVIGEIADVNLSKGTTHTVNGWFTIELSPTTGIKPSKTVTPRTTGTVVQNIKGRNIEIDADKSTAVDTATGEVITNDEDVNLAIAETKANKPMYRGKKRIQVSINEELRTYDTEEKKFVRNSSTGTYKPKALKTSEYSGAMPNGMKATVEALDRWQARFSRRITFDRNAHKYYLDGKPVDYSVTQYLESLYGKKNIQGDYSHSSAIGNTIDAISRDYFEDPQKASSTTYPNLNSGRKNEVLQDLARFRNFLDKTYGRNGYVVITDDNFKLVASMVTHDGVKTVGGATDMLVIDSSGNIHIYDFKAKKSGFKEYTNERDYTAQQNMYRKMLQAIPGLQGKVADLHLVWFNTDYMSNRSASYKTDDSGNVIITINGSSIPIQDTPTFKTPRLSDNDRNAFIPLSVSENIGGKQLPGIGPVETQSTSGLASGAVSIGENPTANNNTPASGKTLQQIEDEMKQKKVVGRQTKDAWAAIPDSLKLRMANEGAVLQLGYRNKKATISMSNLLMMSKVLQEANMAAKGGNLSVSEAAKPMEGGSSMSSRENERAARKWLSKNLPTLNSDERTLFVEKIARCGNNAGRVWGSYRRGVMEIQRNAPMGTVYHEAFHYVLDMVLDDDERSDILNIARQEYGISNAWEAEERLANDFRRFCLDENAEGILGKLRRWFRNIRDRMMRYNRISDQTVNQLFWKINNGELAQKARRVESFDDIQKNIAMEIRKIRQEKISWDSLDSTTRESLEDSGLSKAAYNEMSLEEKEQYIRCRS